MSKILVMTDPHITAPDAQIAGLDSFARLEQGLAHAAHRHGDADHLIIMGDLTHRGTDQEYHRVGHAIRNMPWPVTLMLGNHDDRDNFKTHFTEHALDQKGFVQSVIDLEDVRLITLDSHEAEPPIKHAGLLCPDRLDFLRTALAEANRPCLVFIHHPPFETGFTGMDRIGLLNAPELRDVLKGSAALHLFAGHIHRTITTAVDGLPMTTFKSTCHQMPMLLGKAGSAHSVDEPGAYGILLTSPQGVVVHFEDFSLPEREITQESTSH